MASGREDGARSPWGEDARHTEAFVWAGGKAGYHRNGHKKKTDPSQTGHRGQGIDTQSTRPPPWAPSRLRALPANTGLHHTRGSLALRAHPTGTVQGRKCHLSPRTGQGRTAESQDCHPKVPSLCACTRAAVMGAGEELQHPRSPELLPAALGPSLTRRAAAGGILLQGAGANGWATAPLLSCSSQRGATLVLSGRGNAALGTPRAAGSAPFDSPRGLQLPAFVREAAPSSPRPAGAGAFSPCLPPAAATSAPVAASPVPSAVPGSAAILRHRRHRREHRHRLCTHTRVHPTRVRVALAGHKAPPPQSRRPGSFVSLRQKDGNKTEPATTRSPRDGRRTRLMPHPAAQAAPSLHPPRDPQSTRLYLQDRGGMWPFLAPAPSPRIRSQQPSPLPCGSAVEAHPPSSPLARALGVSLPARPQPSLPRGGGRSATGLCALCRGLQERQGGRLVS